MHDAIVMSVLTLAAVACVMLVVYLRHNRAVLRHQERMTVIEKGGTLPGLDEERPQAPWNPRVYYLRGLVWLFLGLAMTISLTCISITAQHPPRMSDRVYTAQSLRRNGASEGEIQKYMAEAEKEKDGMPLGVATLGLIPVGVGLAYVLFYRKEQQSAQTSRDAA